MKKLLFALLIFVLIITLVLIPISVMYDGYRPVAAESLPTSDRPESTMPPTSAMPMRPTSEIESELPIVSELEWIEPVRPPVGALITIDNTPADVYVDIRASIDKPGNNLPWTTYGETRDENWYIIATIYKEINLAVDGIGSRPWEYFIQAEPWEHDQIRTTVDVEWKNFPRRQIQNKYAARIVANEMLELWRGGNPYFNWALGGVLYDPHKNIWIFSITRNPSGGPGWGIAYAINGYNSQFISTWLS